MEGKVSGIMRGDRAKAEVDTGPNTIRENGWQK